MKRVKRRHLAMPEVRMGGDPVLGAVCRPVEPEDDVGGLCRDMTMVVLSRPTCLGLSANQIGVGLRVIAVRDMGHRNLVTCYVNPRVAYTGIEVATESEGCLSYPGVFVNVKRWMSLRLNSDGREGRTFVDLASRVVQHELDHLEGRCPLGRVPATVIHHRGILR